MKSSPAPLITRYRKALRTQIAGLKPLSQDGVARLGRSIADGGVKTVELLDAHVRCMTEDVFPGPSPGSRKSRSQCASMFLAGVLTAQGGAEGSQRLRTTRDLCGQIVDFAVKNDVLHDKIERTKASVSGLRQKEVRLTNRLQQAEGHLEQIRAFSRQILIAQEEERRKISRDLHDVIAQSLTAINIRLVALRKEATLNTKSLAGKIAMAQRLLASSTRIVHQFARELRPAVLEDIGLVPALDGALKSLQGRTGIKTKLASFPEVETLSLSSRTTLFRVAQEALSNTTRHAQASELKLTLRRQRKMVIMEIADNGKSFDPDKPRPSHSGRGLGLLGMRERLEIAGGRLEIKTSPGHGTRIIAFLPMKDPTS